MSQLAVFCSIRLGNYTSLSPYGRRLPPAELMPRRRRPVPLSSVLSLLGHVLRQRAIEVQHWRAASLRDTAYTQPPAAFSPLIRATPPDETRHRRSGDQRTTETERQTNNSHYVN